MLVSIIIPSYNEKDTLSEIVDLVNNQKDIEKEIIVIDDYSTDGTRELIKKEIFNKVSKVMFKTNRVDFLFSESFVSQYKVSFLISK